MQMSNAQCGLISGHFLLQVYCFLSRSLSIFCCCFGSFVLFVCDYDFLAFFCFLVTGSVLSSNHRFKNKYVIGRICHDRIKHDIGFLSNAVISKEQIYKCECV